MSAVIRLKRMGTNKRPFHRIIVVDKHGPRDGRSLDRIGYYDPLKNPVEVKIDAEKAKYWLKVGAKPSLIVGKLFKKAGIK